MWKVEEARKIRKAKREFREREEHIDVREREEDRRGDGCNGEEGIR